MDEFDRQYERNMKGIEYEKSGEIDRIKDTCINQGINDHVTFRSGFSNDEKNDLLFGSDIYLLPSYAEGLPISLLEAMAAGLPIISTPVGGIPEVIVEGENGFLITPGDYVDLANKIIKLIETPELRMKIGQKNENKIRDEYDWNIISDKLKNEYRTLLCQNDGLWKYSKDISWNEELYVWNIFLSTWAYII